jgi:phosphoserine aminotransferase
VRVINFSPGPAGLPLPSLERLRDELLDFEGTGMSIMEQSHRGKAYERVHGEAIERLTALLTIPQTHQVLFLTGGATAQFGLIPLNFLPPSKTADYVITGHWSERAFEEAQSVGNVRVAFSSKEKDGGFRRVPRQDEVQIAADAAYLHTTSNNTIYGTQFHTLLDSGSIPQVCDMSSDFLWRPFDIGKFAFAYAGAQKNLGPSGVVVAVVNKDFVAGGNRRLPKALQYQTAMTHNSLFNTPPTLAIYLVRNVLAWIESEGGLAGMEARNQHKASLLYGALDRLAGFYRAPVERASRSVMNIVFYLPSEALEVQFVKEAEAQHMVGLKGYRTVGGIRVSAYNAVSPKDIATLVSFMEAFAAKHG